MKVRSLLLENYRRHRRTEIAFPAGVTAIVGSNGAGKSTVLEALAFGLFGPKAARTQKGLVRSTGAAPDETVGITLDLELGTQAIRIRRELRGRNQTPHASLTIDGVLVVQPQAGSSDKVTEQVEKLLGIDREGFFQTLVAQQGELGRLGQLAPADRRKSVLGLLGIDALDAAIDRARERRRQAEAQVEALAGIVQDTEALTAQVQDRKVRLATAVTALEAAAQAVKFHEEGLTAAQAAWAALEARSREREQVAGELRTAEKELAGAAQQLAQARARLAEVDVAVKEAERWRQEAEQLEPRERQLLDVEERIRGREQRVRLLGETEAQQRAIAELKRRQEALASPPPPPDLAALEKAGQDAAAAVARCDAEARLLGIQHAQQAERHAKMARLGDAATCPTCEQPLAGRSAVLSRLDVESAELHRRWQAAQHALAEARRADADLQARLRAARLQEVAVQRAREERQRITVLIEAEQGRLSTLLAALPADPGPVPDRSTYALAVAQARRARESWLRASTLAARRPILVEEEGRCSTAAVQAQGMVESLRLRFQALPQEDAAPVRAGLSLAEKALAGARDAAASARLAESHCRRDLDDAVRVQAENQERAIRLAALRDDLRTWTALAGRTQDGLLDRFKDHLVARLGPAIAQEASRLLSLFTAGRYTELILDDAYEVWVADGGVHYELARFSGGEQDLVHLAIRLGISRLLASRSGGPELRFLALDEAFGGLDGERRDLVVAALHQLTSLYDQVLVITHQESLQEGLDGAIRIGEKEGEATILTA